MSRSYFGFCTPFEIEAYALRITLAGRQLDHTLYDQVTLFIHYEQKLPLFLYTSFGD